MAILSILEDRDGTVWAGGASGSTGRICAIQNGGARCYGEDGSLGRSAPLYQDGRGDLSGCVRLPACGDGSPALPDSIRFQTRPWLSRKAITGHF